MAKYIAVIGDAETVKGFAAVGLDIFPCDDFEHAAKLLRNLTDGDRYAIIYLTEEVYLSVEKERARCAQRLTPAIIPIPSVRGSLSTGRQRLSSFVEQAVGSDIIFNN